jgi:hypothetical protein
MTRCSRPGLRYGCGHRLRCHRVRISKLIKLIRATTPCMPCSFGLLPCPGQERGALSTGLLSDHDCPLVSAAHGTRVARPARRTRPSPGGDGSHIGQRVRPVLGEPPLVGTSPEGLAAAGWGDSNSGPPSQPPLRCLCARRRGVGLIDDDHDQWPTPACSNAVGRPSGNDWYGQRG